MNISKSYKFRMHITHIIVLLLLISIPLHTQAHQPRIVESNQTQVIDPEISKAYYGQLKGIPDVFTIQADETFDLYVNVLVPDIASQKKDISATIFKNEKPFMTLNGKEYTWKKMFEPFGYDTYWTGPEYKAKVEAGKYTVIVTSDNNDSKYSLAIGEVENFDFKEIINALTLVPRLKSDFFNESPISFIFSPFGWGMIVILYILGALFGFSYRFILKKITKNIVRGLNKNIGKKDRAMRLLIAITLLIWAITTTWNPILIFISGFTLFEAVFSWCGFYAAIGKNTCPVG